MRIRRKTRFAYWLGLVGVLAAAAPLALGPVVAAPAATRVSAVRVACVGDSITYGAGIGDRAKDSYPAQLGRLLGPKCNVQNFGVSGATLLKKGDKPYYKEKAFQAALALKPHVLIVALGTNDTKPQNWQHKKDFAADYKALLAAFRKVNPKVRLYVCLPVPAFPGRWGIRDEVVRDEVIPLVRAVAKETKATVIDLYAALADKKDLFPDTVHPNAKGAGLMADAICESLTGRKPPRGS